MRAAVMRAVDEPLSIEEVDIAEPGPREVVVRVAAAGLCHSDVRYMEGSYPLNLPAILGHESAGVVEAVGPGVTHVEPGDHVITCLSVFCGSCTYCRSGRSYQCIDRAATQRPVGEMPRLSVAGSPIQQFLNLSSFAEQMLIHENAMVRVTDEIPLERAALLGCGVATGLGAVLNTAAVQPGESVVVIGCGGVGLSAIQGARIAGADPIVAVDRIGEKLELARRFGATHVFDPSPGVVPAVKDLTDGLGVDKSFEAIGNVSTTEMAFAMLRPGGVATLIGLIPRGQNLSIPGEELVYEKRLQGSNMGSNNFRVDVPRYVDMYLQGVLMLDELITHTMPLEAINEGFDEMRSGKVGRNLIVF